MTKEEFIQRHRAQQKHANRWSILWIVLLFAFFGGSALLGRHIDEYSKRFQLIYMVVFAIVVFVQLPVLIWVGRRQTKAFGLHCPACGAALAGTSAQIAIAAGHCGHCGARLFSDEAPSSNSP